MINNSSNSLIKEEQNELQKRACGRYQNIPKEGREEK